MTYLPAEAVATKTMTVFQVMHPVFEEGAFIELLQNYGFTNEWDLTLLSDKYFRGLSDQAIYEARCQGWISRRTVTNHLKKLRKLLKERGFEQEIWSWEPK